MSSSLLKNIAIDALHPGMYQPRKQFCAESLQELADSIKQQGLIEPIIVRPRTASTYEIIAGERRFRAAQMAGLHELACLISDYTDEQAAAVTLIENIQRKDLTVIEEASAYRRLMDEFYFQHDDVALMVGKSRSHISNLVRLLSLEETVQMALNDKRISMGHARTLVGFEPAEQRLLLQKTCRNEWSVRRLEQEIKQLKTTKRKPSSDRDVARLEALIAEQCGSAAEIEQGAGSGGWLKMQFFDNDTLAGILDRLGVNYQDT